MAEETLDSLLERFGADSTPEMVQQILVRWRESTDRAASMAFLQKVRQLSQDLNLAKERRLALIFLLGEMLHDDPGCDTLA